MSIQFGANKLMPIYLGGSRVTSAYFGGVLVYEEVTAPDYFEFVLEATPTYLFIRSAYTDAASKPGKCYINGTEYTADDWELLSKSSYSWWSLYLSGAVQSGDTIRVYGVKPGVKVNSYGNSILNDVGWDNTNGCNTAFHVTAFDRNWTTMQALFSNSPGLTAIPSTWNGCENVLSLKEAFTLTNGTDQLVGFPDSYKGLDSVQTTDHMFYGRRNMVNGGTDVSSFSALSNITNCTYMFYSCIKWTGKAFDLYSYLSSKTSPAVSQYGGTFYGCTSADRYNLIPNVWRR